MLAPPRCPALTILANQNSEPDTGAPITLLAAPAERQHAIGQLVMDDAGRWRRRGCRSDSDRNRVAVLWCNYHPGAIGAAPITTILVVIVAARACLALRSYNRASCTADNCPRAAPRPPPSAPPRIAPAAPPIIAPPTGSCAPASCTGKAMARLSRAAAPNARFM